MVSTLRVSFLVPGILAVVVALSIKRQGSSNGACSGLPNTRFPTALSGCLCSCCRYGGCICWWSGDRSKQMQPPTLGASPSGFRPGGEAEILDLHRRNNRREGLFTCRQNRLTDFDDVLEHVDYRLVEAQVFDAPRHLAVLDQERAVTSHAREQLGVGIDVTHIPHTRQKNAALSRCDHLLQRRVTAGDDDVHREFAFGRRRRRTVTGRASTEILHRATALDRSLELAVLDDRHGLAVHAFVVEEEARLQLVIGIIRDGDVLPEHRLADLLVERGRLVPVLRAGEVVVEEADEVENRGRLQNHRVVPGTHIHRIAALASTRGSTFGQSDRVHCIEIAPVTLLPAGRRSREHRDRALDVGLLVKAEEPGGVADRIRIEVRSEDSSGAEATASCNLDDGFDALQSILGSECRDARVVARELRRGVLGEIRRLEHAQRRRVMRQNSGGFNRLVDCALDRFRAGAVRRESRSATLCVDGDGHRRCAGVDVLRHLVVGKPRGRLILLEHRHLHVGHAVARMRDREVDDLFALCFSDHLEPPAQ